MQLDHSEKPTHFDAIEKQVYNIVLCSAFHIQIVLVNLKGRTLLSSFYLLCCFYIKTSESRKPFLFALKF